jgi:hypothetical protein
MINPRHPGIAPPGDERIKRRRKNLATCIKCNKLLPPFEVKGDTICADCVDNLITQATPDELGALAKVGFDALIDEATGYQKTRPKNDLQKRLAIYKKEITRLKEGGIN